MKLIFRPIHKGAEEFREVTRAPLSRTMETYIEMHSFGFPDRPTAANLPVSVRLAGVGKLIHERMSILSDVLRRLENLGWDIHTDGDLVVVLNDLSLEDGWGVLRREGISDHILGLVEKGSDVAPPQSLAGGGEEPEEEFGSVG